MLTSRQLTFFLIIFALVLTLITCLVVIIRTPPHLQRSFDRAVRRCGLKNSQEEFPTLISVKRDKDKPHGLILKIKNQGITIPAINEKVESLKLSLKGIIYHIEDDEDTDYSLIWLLPNKYVHPALFSPSDNAIGDIGINQLINMLIVGATGTGKTVATKILMAKISQFQTGAKIWLLDFKQFDFQDFSSLPRYYGFTNCVQGLTDFYNTFKQQQQLGIVAEPNYLICDEWSAFITSLEKKDADRCKAMLSELLMHGRSYQFIPIIGMQRADATHFVAGARDNFQCCLALGNLSREGRKMVFPDDLSELVNHCGKREGNLYIATDGIGLGKIRIADISNMEELDAIIRNGMLR